MFTVMFAIARTVGWMAHWMEMMDDPDQRIGRPRQIYTDMTCVITSRWISADSARIIQPGGSDTLTFAEQLEFV